jgi:cephalosporin hydroxylase
MVSSPGVTLVTLLGEGSFHQVHGGTTTNREAPAELIKSFEEQYADLRGRGFKVPNQDAFYLGWLPEPARRIKPRRVHTFRHFRDAHVGTSEKRPRGPFPVPQDLKVDFIDAFWRSEEWHRTPWLGKSTHRPPTDLFAYQELIWRLRPEWIVETRTGTAGRSQFLASICDLVGSGQVLSIDAYPVGERPEHARITYLDGDPGAPAVGARAREITGEEPGALVILGGGSSAQVVGAFHNYWPLVPVGGYLVVEDTILEGNPVWPEFGAGPRSAMHRIMDEGRFAPDYSMERYALTFNLGGWLKRIR